MSYCEQSSLPVAEPVLLQNVKARLRLPSGNGPYDDVLSGLISSVREDGERLSGLTLAQRTFTQVLDSFPYYTDTIQSQQAYPPSYYSLPRYSTTLWNYSQMIKLARAPLVSIEKISYVGTDGLIHILPPDQYVIDPECKLARVFPVPGQYWPAVLYVPNAVKIDFTAGFDPDPTKVLTFGLPSPPPVPPNQQTTYSSVIGIPQSFLDAMMALIVYKYQFPGEPGVPQRYETAFQAPGIVDFAPTRG